MTVSQMIVFYSETEVIRGERRTRLVGAKYPEITEPGSFLLPRGYQVQWDNTFRRAIALSSSPAHAYQYSHVTFPLVNVTHANNRVSHVTADNVCRAEFTFAVQMYFSLRYPGSTIVTGAVQGVEHVGTNKGNARYKADIKLIAGEIPLSKSNVVSLYGTPNSPVNTYLYNCNHLPMTGIWTMFVLKKNSHNIIDLVHYRSNLLPLPTN